MKTIIVVVCAIVLDPTTTDTSGGDQRQSVDVSTFRTLVISDSSLYVEEVYNGFPLCPTISVPSPTELAIQEEKYRQIMETYQANRKQREFWNNVWQYFLIPLFGSAVMLFPVWMSEIRMRRSKPRTG